MKDTSSALPAEFVAPAALAGMECDTAVLVAFSGGADSTALLHMTVRHSRTHGGKVFAAHVNHMIRGEEADRDEQFCRRTADALGVPIFVCRRDVPAFARESSQSVETAARQVRYEFFDKVMAENGITLLATAHNANDNLETQIFNLARGCGLDGMCGIPETRPCDGGTVVRPILRMSRARILEYCREHKLEYVTDSTNTDTDYTRNKIRAEIIPALMEINASAVENASRLSASLREDALCIDSLAEWFLEEMNDDASFELEKILGSPPAVANRAIRALYSHVSEGASLEYAHLSSIRKLCENAVTHSSLDLPCGIQARIENGRLCLDKKTQAPTPTEDYEVTLTDGINTISAIRAQIIMGNSQKTLNIYKKSILMYFDFAKINGTLTARNRRAGDKIKLRGVNRSVKKLLCDLKVPLDVRYRLPVICDGEGIVAVPFAAVRDGVSADKSKDKADTLCLQFNLF